MRSSRLRSVASICLQTKRDSDVVARIGGEEFAIMLPEANINSARTFAERLRRSVSESTHKVNDETLTVSVSIGIAEATASMAGIEALLDAADAALYEAKFASRNCVRRAGRSPCAIS